ncbi:uncharacterized protein LOC103315566 [Nasonia vitripennis]|uniref:Uncharacterized protein n=1 Tax=Nasonia vitripennis TaxID=7425 RepID=A0A7M7H1N4_NASVI|nr:uncharacterized protein LOC103315566 [Nasonia vitripennis]
MSRREIPDEIRLGWEEKRRILLTPCETFVLHFCAVQSAFQLHRGMSQPVHEPVAGINRESSLPTYEEVCSTSRVEIGFEGDLTRATAPVRTSCSNADNSRRLPSTNQGRVGESRADEPQTKQSKKCLIFSITAVVVFCYLFTVVGLLRSKNCSLLSAGQPNSVEVENKILTIHRSYDKKINYLNVQLKDANRMYEKEINSLLRARDVTDIEKQKLNSKIEELRSGIDTVIDDREQLRKKLYEVIGQREQLYWQVVKAGLRPVYDIMASTTDRSSQESKKVTTSLYDTLFQGSDIFQRYYNGLLKN